MSAKEVRLDIEEDDLAVLDGYVSATGSNRSKVIGELIKKFSAEQLHIATIVCRMARVNPLAVAPERHDGGK
jgi:hypothetical protein